MGSMLRLMPTPVCCTAASATAPSATPEPPTLPPPTVMPVPDTVLAMLVSATTPASGRGRLRPSLRLRLMMMLVCTMAVMPVTTVWPDTATVLAMLPVPTLPPLTVTPGLTPLPPHTATGLPTVSGPDTCGKYLQFHKSLPLPQNLSNQNSPSATKLR